MNPGDLRHRIEILTNQKAKNELEETIYKFIPVKKLWAAIIPQTGSLQKQVADTILTNVTHKIIVRYNAGKDITKNMRIRFKDHEFEIKYVLNPYFKNETLEIFVQEVLK
ncbi:head-tail adaptor protein [Lysinibacillus sphaericus]|uniref:Head-tail adaptor protein n=1 Tax=Lysinibacillus sphaericus TaxID=1421 RepID=A0A2S0K5N3_LYSSH|nr:phage head closure protein [Lysinibacillus sphaericus]AVK98648.1 head-tail adaptor protein [Lysinibacillus sphaericus]MED4543178.1 phage head closure protein [Lysinibacillus sphaericus]TKI16484.1 head-tail adaptor protein [Lysinibacillus sphaericus]SUV15369.1 phage head-tail adaptor [Lysinibacillus sphaericus]